MLFGCGFEPAAVLGGALAGFLLRQPGTFRFLGASRGFRLLTLACFAGEPFSLGFGRFAPALFHLALPRFFRLAPLALVRRYPWFMQRVRNSPAKSLQPLPDFGRIWIVMAQFAPIKVLTGADDAKHGIVAPQFLILQRRNRNVEDRKN